MKLIFLHGLGQDVLSWQGVQYALSPMHSKTFDIFSHPSESYQEVKARLMERLQQESEPFILVGLSLGGVLALDLSEQDFPQLKGLVLAGTQYKLTTNPLYRLQILLFRLLPKHVFEKQDANKQQMLRILTELKGLNLTDTAKACSLPSLVICGSKDWANQSSSKKLAKLLPKGRYQEIADGGHLLNTEKPYELAQAIKEFVGEFKTKGGWDKSPSLSIVFGLSSKTQWLSGLYYADFISFYSPTQLCGGGTTKSNSNELTISVPLSFLMFLFLHLNNSTITS